MYMARVCKRNCTEGPLTLLVTVMKAVTKSEHAGSSDTQDGPRAERGCVSAVHW